MRLSFIFSILSILVLDVVHAGSILSSRGLGLPFDFADARSMGMGELAVANPDPNRIARINPAALSTVTTTRLNLQYMVSGNRYQDNEASANSTYSNFDGFSFGTPLGLGLHVAMGLNPLTRVSYNLAHTAKLQDSEYVRSVEGSGGLNAMSIAVSWSPIKNLSIGLKGMAAFGKITERWRVRFDDGAAFTSTYDKLSTHYEGIGFTTGVLYRPFSWWILGAVYRSNLELDSETDILHIYTNPAEAVGSYTYPGYLGVGTTFIIRNKYIVGFDYRRTDWTKTAVNDIYSPQTSTANAFAFGFEKAPDANPFAKYLKRIPIRLGVNFKPYSSLDQNGNTINESWLTFGLGLPLFRNASHIDIALGIGKRGSVEKNGIEDNLLRLTLSLTGGERWFVRTY